MNRRIASAIVLLAVSAFPSWARAQANVALDRYDPSPAGSRLLSVADPSVTGRLRLHGAYVLSYADAPLMLNAAGRLLGEQVDHQLVLHALFAVDLFDRVKVAMDLPLVVNQGGVSPSYRGYNFVSPHGQSMGDIRLSANGTAFRQAGAVPAVGLGFSTWLPSGDSTSFNGAEIVRWGAEVVLGADYPDVIWRLSVARKHQSDDALVLTAHSGWAFAGGIAYRHGSIQLGPEFFGFTTHDPNHGAFSKNGTNLEALMAFRVACGPLVFGTAMGPGLTTGPGTPGYRALISLALAQTLLATKEESVTSGSSTSTQGDAGQDHSEGASFVGQSRKGRESHTYAQNPDRDGDGVPDASDSCPDEFGSSTTSASRPGCPPDLDGDTIADTKDACPAVPGVASPVLERNGCPKDSDEDGIDDAHDACPSIKGSAADSVKTNGCPQTVVVQGEQLVLTQQVRFALGSDEILAESNDLLTQLARIIQSRPDIARVAVNGHTDNVGTDERNLALSRRRALSVVRWLVAHGIDERRLEARGFGPRQPITPNTSDAAREQNRRVEFHIVRKTNDGERGWKDGPINER